MSETIKKYIDPIKTFWNKMSKKGKKIFFIVLGGIFVVALMSVILLNMPSYVVLYPGLDRDEALEVMTLLDERGVDYREDNGTIMVPQAQEAALRMDLSNAGHPRTAPNYDFFLNNVDIMTTDMERQIIKDYQLEQKLVAVIKSIDVVKNATVTINIPKNDGYVLSSKDKQKTTASVTVTLTKELEPTQVNGIKRLVANSVLNLDLENVAVIDTATGNELMGSSSNQVDMTQLKRTVEREFENDIQSKVMGMLTKLFGTENVSVVAKSSIDIDKRIQEITTYTPSGDGNTGVISGEQHENEAETGEGGSIGVPGTDTNTGVPGYPGITVEGDKVYVKNNDSYEYLVSKLFEQVQRDSGELKDLTISVLINRASLGGNQEAGLTQLVANAAGVEVDKVFVYPGTFNGSDNPVENPNVTPNIWSDMTMLLFAAGTLAVLLTTILILLIVSKRRKKKLRALEAAEAHKWDGVKPLTPARGDGEDEGIESLEDELASIQVKETKEHVLRKKIQEFTSQNPEISAQLVRTWLKGDDSDG